jgi:hypothetical protein
VLNNSLSKLNRKTFHDGKESKGNGSVE